MTHKPRIAWFSPLNCSDTPSQSSAAFFSDQVLPHLKNEFEIELFHDSFLQYKDFKSAHFLSAFKRHKEIPFDIFFYQLEDSRATAFIRAHLALIPGVVLFHDFILSDDGPEPILNSPWIEIVKRFKDSKYPWPQREAEHKAQRPYALRESAFAVVPLFSSVRWGSEHRAHAKLKLIEPKQLLRANYVPFPAASIERAKPIKELRIASCASTRIEGRMHLVFAALSQLNSKWRFDWLIAPSEILAAKRLVEEFELTSVNLIAERSTQRWRHLLRDCDVAVHLHFSVYGQLGPYIEQSMAAGVALIVSQFGSTEALSSEIAFKILPGANEQSELAAVFQILVEDRKLCQNATALEYASEFFTPSSVAAELSTVFRNSQPDLNEFYREWSQFEEQAKAALIEEVGQLHNSVDPRSDPLLLTFSELGFV